MAAISLLRWLKLLRRSFNKWHEHTARIHRKSITIFLFEVRSTSLSSIAVAYTFPFLSWVFPIQMNDPGIYIHSAHVFFYSAPDEILLDATRWRHHTIKVKYYIFLLLPLLLPFSKYVSFIIQFYEVRSVLLQQQECDGKMNPSLWSINKCFIDQVNVNKPYAIINKL